jgi:hypothetical protein
MHFRSIGRIQRTRDCKRGKPSLFGLQRRADQMLAPVG